MSVNIAINGLGRIGRAIIRSVIENDLENINIVAANGAAPIENYALLLQYDSIHGKLNKEVTVEGNKINIGRHSITIFSDRDPAQVPWEEKNAEIVMECTGKFKSKEDASKHIRGSVKNVIISAPSSNPDATIVCGVNDNILRENHKVISIGSCTTNALAPIAKILNDNIGIVSGYMTTIHAYTNDQNVLDNSHKDLRRARASSISMIPTSTGAAKAISEVIPELYGKLSGSAIRVPVPNVSMVDLSFVSERSTSKEEINKIINNQVKNKLQNIISITKHKLVSIDFNHNSSSSIFDPFETSVVNKNFVRVVAWYDNEWGFACRMIDVALMIMKARASKCYETLKQ